MSGPFHPLFVFAIALQAIVAADLMRRREPWTRPLALAFLLNAVGTLSATEDAVNFPGASEWFQLIDGPTGTCLLAAALLYPHRHPWFARGLAPVVAVQATAVVLRFGFGLDASMFAALYNIVPLIAGYLAIVLRIALPYARDPSMADAATPWLLAGLLPRAVELPVRYLSILTFEPSTALLLIGLGAILAASIVVGAQLARSLGRWDVRLVCGMMLLGATLGAADAFVNPATPTVEVLRRISLVVFRPVFVLVAIIGLRSSTGRLGPVGLSFAAAMLATAVLGTTVVAPVAEVAGSILGLAVLLLFSITGVLSERRDGETSDPAAFTEKPLARPPQGDRWQHLLAVLADPDLEADDVRRTRAGLATVLGVAPRNVHRTVLEAERNGTMRAGIPGPLVAWEERRGPGGQLRFYYRLTGPGQRAAALLAGQPISRDTQVVQMPAEGAGRVVRP